MGVFRKQGEWWIDYYDENDCRKRKKVGRSKKVAQNTLEEMRTQVRQRKLGIAEAPTTRRVTVSDFFFTHCFEYFDTNLSARTAKRYKAVVNHLWWFLSQHTDVKYLTQLRTQHIEKYKTHRKTVVFPRGFRYFDKPVEELKQVLEEAEANGCKAATDSTVNFEIQTLRTVFNLAIAWHYLPDNPANKVKFLRVTDSKKPRFLSEAEVAELLERSEGEVQLIFRTFVLTGMRSGELMNLEWEDVDFELGVIYIRNKDFWHPKRRHERDIPIHAELLPLLKTHKREKEERSNFVFCNGGDKPYSENGLRRALAKVTKESSFPEVTQIHALRHTFGSQLVMQGVDLPTVADLMGHRDIETTMIYVHRTPDHLKQSVDRLRA